jgi:putative membrane protein
MMFLDIVIDPVALLGERWFLGKIYEYPGGGIYFGVTIMNFVGWFLVCFLIIRCYIILERLLFGGPRRSNGADEPWRNLLRTVGTPGLYFGVLAFNLVVTFWIGETRLGLTGLFLTLGLLFPAMMWVMRLRRAQPARD